MRKSDNSSNQKQQPEHVKKHDHSTLGKHTKAEKQKYLNSTKNNKKTNASDDERDQNSKPEHVKKHDHSILGKHTKKEKQKYLDDLADNKE